MLNFVHIHKYRSCTDVRFDNIGRITALIGRNGAGKTNVLKGIEWVAAIISDRAANSPAASHRVLRDVEEPGSVTISFAIEGGAYTYFINKLTRYRRSDDGSVEALEIFKEELTEHGPRGPVKLLERDNERVIFGASGTEVAVSTSSSAIAALIALLPESDSLRPRLDAIREFFAGVIYYPLEQALGGVPRTRIVTAEDFAKWNARPNRFLLNSVESTIMRVIKLFLENPKKLEELQSLLGDDGLGLVRRIDVQRIETHLDDSADDAHQDANGSDEKRYLYFIRFSPCGQTGFFSFDSLSFGTKRVIQLVASMLVDQASVALIEQPEDGIHPGLLHKLTPLLRTYAEDNQFILASHAPGVLDRLEPKEIRLVEMTESGTTVRALSSDELSIAHDYLADDGPLSDFLESL
ncbi:ATP-binding protein [Burkholderia sp. Tr-862]|uniref:AAA family ATPase n=1 Tax=Burkholderia sp. Tr-862 TaxID=2608331 RepID=UPI001FFC60B9|nr:ATP-binding protein [Burkholderia sp. Tr-862]